MKTKPLAIFLILAVFLFALSGCSELVLEARTGENGDGEIGNDFPFSGLPGEDGEETEDEKEEKDIYILANAPVTIRSGPGTGYSSLGKTDTGDMLSYRGKEGSWYITVYKEKTAYVSDSFTELYTMEKGSEIVERVLDFGETLLGYPYVWGSQRYHWGNGKLNPGFQNGKFDCSAFTQYIYYKGAGVLLDLTTRTQVLQGSEVKKEDIKRGDLLFFTNSSRKNYSGTERVGHVAIYLGDNYILHTASDYAVIEEISVKRWSYYITARRFFN